MAAAEEASASASAAGQQQENILCSADGRQGAAGAARANNVENKKTQLLFLVCVEFAHTMASAGDAVDEDVALTIAEAFVYKIPPRQAAGGHKASDWTEQVAVVRVEVVTRGRDHFVRLLRPDSGKVFAVAPCRYGAPSAVEQTTDSSRYFALRIENGQG